MQFTTGNNKKLGGDKGLGGKTEKNKLISNKNSSLLRVNKSKISNNTMNGTPEGGEESKEDLDGFKHEYYELSVKIIDLLLLGKE